MLAHLKILAGVCLDVQNLYQYLSGEISNVVSHPVHLKSQTSKFSPSALIPYCAFKSNLTMETEDKHPNLSFPICTSFVPDILEGQLCYTLKLNWTGGKGKRNGLMLLLDLNHQRSFETTLQKDQTIEDISQMSLDTELSRRDTSAKIQINAMSPTKEYGHGTYKMTSVKRMRATRDFLGMDQGARNCELETYEECRTRHLMDKCRCVPWELQHIKVRTKILNSFLVFQEGPICTPFGRDCVDAEASKTYKCKTSCTGIYTDVQWHNETVGNSRDGGSEENKESYYLLVNEYREFQRNYSRNFRFEAEAQNETFGEKSTLETIS